MTLDERIAALEGDISKFKDTSKDKWDKFGVLCSALIPLSIAAVGGYYSYTSENSKTEQAKYQAKLSEESKQIELQQAQIRAIAESKIRQAELVSKFFDALTGQDDKRREFAVNALLVAAPDYGPVLVRTVSEAAPTPKAANFAASALNQRRDLLVRQLYGEDAQLRKDAYNQLVNSWSSDLSLVEELVRYGTENKSNVNGVYNAIVLLSHLQRDTIVKRREAILTFAKLAEANGEKTAERVAILRGRLG
jgi:hypothetical protein